MKFLHGNLKMFHPRDEVPQGATPAIDYNKPAICTPNLHILQNHFNSIKKSRLTEVYIKIVLSFCILLARHYLGFVSACCVDGSCYNVFTIFISTDRNNSMYMFMFIVHI